jgi:hypothetical protein
LAAYRSIAGGPIPLLHAVGFFVTTRTSVQVTGNRLIATTGPKGPAHPAFTVQPD